ncbi:MAG: LysE family transporter [Methanomicrobiales archaeon]|nr:LysE family transporter [Methanomicrobiales archaeon]
MTPGISETILLSFFIGLSGALAPGPTLVATIQASLCGGWSMGPKVTAGHMLIESLLFLLILTGVSAALIGFSREIAVIGGISLIVFGIMTLKGSGGASGVEKNHGVVSNPYIAGFLTGVSNPYFWIWWFTIGGVLLLSALEDGLSFGVAFMAGHWCADLGWLTLVSLGIDRGRNVLLFGGYRYVLIVCGAAMTLFGLSFIVSSLPWV